MLDEHGSRTSHISALKRLNWLTLMIWQRKAAPTGPTILHKMRLFLTHIFGSLEMLPGCRCCGVLRHDSVAFLSAHLFCSSLWSHLLVPTDEGGWGWGGGGWAEVKVLSACIFQWIRFSRLPLCPSCCYPESMCTVCSCPTYERHF